MCIVVCARIGWWCYSSSGRLCTGAARTDGSVGRERWEGRTLALPRHHADCGSDGRRDSAMRAGEHVEMSVLEFGLWMAENHPTIQIDFVPGGCTGVGQPLDVGINRAFKHALKVAYHAWLVDALLAQRKRG
ncbi:hypothetical protein DFH08DRAFT_820740 [Mycena albidolilacea]|uniref:Uncharacterized protein n=1 Tax=Mycena albidolilacea TaxID=1033008 RepID=A0AAD6ZC33_9AGAR|nr:hypothetical protein DFH08DRAFT_820740 [Mycena albidolilacea]